MRRTLPLLLIIVLLLPGGLNAQFNEIDVRFNGISPVNDTAVSQGLVKFLSISEGFSFKFSDTLSRPTTLQPDKDIVVRYLQCFGGKTITFALVRLYYSSGKLYRIRGNYMKDEPCASDTPALSERRAFELAKLYINGQKYAWEDSVALDRLVKAGHAELLYPQPHGELVYYTPVPFTGCHIPAYKFHMVSPGIGFDNYLYIDAASGEVAGFEDHYRDVLSYINPSKEVSIATYPNPAGDFLNILFLTGIEIEATVSIVDVDFKLVKQEQLNTKLSRIDLRDVATGVYYAHVSHGGKKTSVKFVKH